MQKTEIKIGQRIHTNLYSHGFGTVYAIHEGNPNPMFNRGPIVDIVFDNGVLFDKFTASSLENLPWSVLWDAPLASPVVIEEALARANAEKTAKEMAEVERQMNMEKRRHEQDAKYSHLKRVKEGDYSTAALGAANIRIELKRAFPGTKFSVTSKTYSGGDSINVSWHDGPNSAQVEAIADKYEEGSFNSMEDLYERNKNDVFTPVFGGAKYVFCQREIPEAAFNLLVSEVCRTCAVEGKPGPDARFANDYVSSIARRIYSETPIPKGDSIAKLEHAEEGRYYLKAVLASQVEAAPTTPAEPIPARQPKPRFRYDHATAQLVPVV